MKAGRQPFQIIRAPLVTGGRASDGATGPTRLAAALLPLLGDGAADAAPAATDLADLGARVNDALRAGERPVILGGDCSIVAGYLSAAWQHTDDLRLCYLDAHGDFNTETTSPSGNVSGMCLAHVCGDFVDELPWHAERPFDGRQAWLLGARSLDLGEKENLTRRQVTHLERLAMPALPQGTPLWIHLDLDIVDPGEMFAVRHPAPGGVSFAELEAWLAAIQATFVVRGLALCGYLPEKDPSAILPARITRALAPLFLRQ